MKRIKFHGPLTVRCIYQALEFVNSCNLRESHEACLACNKKKNCTEITRALKATIARARVSASAENVFSKKNLMKS